MEGLLSTGPTPSSFIKLDQITIDYLAVLTRLTLLHCIGEGAWGGGGDVVTEISEL